MCQCTWEWEWLYICQFACVFCPNPSIFFFLTRAVSNHQERVDIFSHVSSSVFIFQQYLCAAVNSFDNEKSDTAICLRSMIYEVTCSPCPVLVLFNVDAIVSVCLICLHFVALLTANTGRLCPVAHSLLPFSLWAIIIIISSERLPGHSANVGINLVSLCPWLTVTHSWKWWWGSTSMQPFNSSACTIIPSHFCSRRSSSNWLVQKSFAF